MATRAEILATVTDLLEEVAGVNPAQVAEDKTFTDDLAVDSMDMVEVLVAVEETLGIRIPDQLWGDVKTVADLLDLVEQTQAAR